MNLEKKIKVLFEKEDLELTRPVVSIAFRRFYLLTNLRFICHPPCTKMTTQL